MTHYKEMDREKQNKVAKALAENNLSGIAVLFCLGELGSADAKQLQAEFDKEEMGELSPALGLEALLAVGLISLLGGFYRLTFDGKHILSDLEKHIKDEETGNVLSDTRKKALGME